MIMKYYTLNISEIDNLIVLSVQTYLYIHSPPSPIHFYLITSKTYSIELAEKTQYITCYFTIVLYLCLFWKHRVKKQKILCDYLYFQLCTAPKFVLVWQPLLEISWQLWKYFRGKQDGKNSRKWLFKYLHIEAIKYTYNNKNYIDAICLIQIWFE